MVHITLLDMPPYTYKYQPISMEDTELYLSLDKSMIFHRGISTAARTILGIERIYYLMDGSDWWSESANNFIIRFSSDPSSERTILSTACFVNEALNNSMFWFEKSPPSFRKCFPFWSTLLCFPPYSLKKGLYYSLLLSFYSITSSSALSTAD